MKIKLMFGVLFCIILCGTFVYSMNENNNHKELTASQIDKMIELNLIQVYSTLPEKVNDENIGLSYQTQIGKCDVYKDIFERYYCRW